MSQTAQQVQANAKRKLSELRREIDRYHAARIATDNASYGIAPNRRGLTPDQVALRVRELRDPAAMERAVGRTFDLLTVLYGRDPTEDELAAGPPSGDALNNFPNATSSVEVLSGLAYGAWSLTSLFAYLRGLEERIQTELGIPAPATRGSGLVGAVGLFALGAAAVGVGYLVVKHVRSLGEDEDEDEDEEEEEEELELTPAPAPPTSYHIHMELPSDAQDDEGEEEEDDDGEREARET